MRIGINGQFWNQEFTGSGQYTRNIWYSFPDVIEAEDAPEFYLLGNGKPFEGISPQSQLHYSSPAPVERAGGNIFKVWWEQSGMPALANRQNKWGRPFDLIHYPYFAAPLRRPQNPTAVVVTIHDLIPLALPAYNSGKAAKAYFKLVSAAARKADLIFADSEYSKKDILRYLKVPSSKVAVIYLGVDKRYQPIPLPPEERRALLQKYKMAGDEKIIFYLGGYDIRKNVPTLIKAFGNALPRIRQYEHEHGGGRWKLVLGGKAHTSNLAMYPDLKEPIRNAVGNGEEADRIHFTGLIEEEDKPLFYRIADLYAFPSRYEGFGLDPLEALASGAPVICSNATSLPEVVGNAARLLDPDNVNAWQTAIEELVTSPEQRAELSRLGPQQAAKFTWEGTARRTLQLYRMLECIKTRGK